MDCFEHDFADLGFAYKELWPSSSRMRDGFALSPQPPRRVPSPTLFVAPTPPRRREEDKENARSNGVDTRPQGECSAPPKAETRQASIQRQSEHWMALAAVEVDAAKPNHLARYEKRRKSIRSGKSVVNGVDTFSCTQCVPGSSKLYKSREGLVLHIRNAHENDRPWCCPLAPCSAAYVRRGDLRGHLAKQHLKSDASSSWEEE